jgi:hypothetical protein
MGHEAAADTPLYDLYAVAGYLLSFFSFAVLRLPSSIKQPGLRSGGRSAVARRVLRSPTNCAKAPRAFWPRRPPLVSLRSCLRGRLSSLRDVLGPSPNQRDPGCTEHCLPGAYAEHLITFLGDAFLTRISVSRLISGRHKSQRLSAHAAALFETVGIHQGGHEAQRCKRSDPFDLPQKRSVSG